MRGAVTWVMPDGDGTGLRILSQVLTQPNSLWRVPVAPAYLMAFRIQVNNMPVIYVVTVIAFARLTSRRAKVFVVTGSLRARIIGVPRGSRGRPPR